MIAKELLERDYETRVPCYKDILENVLANFQQHFLLSDETKQMRVSFVTIMIASDEAHFHLSGFVRKQNFRYWSESNPRELHKRPLYCE